MTRRSLLLLLLIGMLLASCGASGAGEGTPDVQGTIQANAQTMVVALFQTQTALAPAATNTALPTITPLASSTALALGQASPTVFVQQPVLVVASPTGPTSTPIAASGGVGCRNLRLINSWTVPDGPLLTGQQFTQNWQVENSGTCDWLFVWEVKRVSGDATGETSSVRFGNKIGPGKWTTIQVGMRAPDKSGTFKASWRMSDGGTVFGDTLPVSIKVGTVTSTVDANATNTAAAAVAQQTATWQAAVQTAAAAALTAQSDQLTAQSAQLTAAAAIATANCVGTQTAGGTCPSP